MEYRDPFLEVPTKSCYNLRNDLKRTGREEQTMLENSLAEKLIEQVTKYTSYNVNIMNEQGVIIASRNPERIGKFHEVAWQIGQ